MEYELRNIIYGYINDICHISQMQVFSTNNNQTNYFQMQIDEKIDALINTILQNTTIPTIGDDLYLQQTTQPSIPRPSVPPVELPERTGPLQSVPSQQVPQTAPVPPETPEQAAPRQGEQGAKQFTPQELANYNGSGGKPAYVAINGTVYDVTNQIRWAGGTHFGLTAGKDLTAQFLGCHQGLTAILNQFPKVGILVK